MIMTDVQANPHKAVENVCKDLDSAKNQKDQTSALDKFQDEIDVQLKSLKTPEERKAFMEQVVEDLAKNKKLPALALAFAGNLDTEFDEHALKDDLRREKYNANNGDAKAILTSNMLRYLVDNYDVISNASNDEFFGE